MGFILGALKVIFLLGTLITIHEFGHFIVAKACGMKVLKFSIGFGPKILKKQGKETEYSLRLLPLGGFVQLEGEDEDSNDPRAYNNKPAWQRMLVLLAGVTINIVFALVIYTIIAMASNGYTTSKISNIPQTSLAHGSGLEIGDAIYKINEQMVSNNYDVSKIISESKEDTFLFEIINKNNQKEQHLINIPTKKIGYIGVAFIDKEVYSVQPGSAGELAGLQPKDILVSIEGKKVETIDEYLKIIKENPEKELKIVVTRETEDIELIVKPQLGQMRTFELEYESLSFFENFKYAINETAYYLKANLIGIGQLFTGKTENVEVQGIVGISQQISSTKQVEDFFYMMSAISLSLGIMNLLPIPGLDGGKLVFTVIEVLRGKPVSREVEGTLTLAGFGLLILLMIVVTVKDVSNLF